MSPTVNNHLITVAGDNTGLVIAYQSPRSKINIFYNLKLSEEQFAIFSDIVSDVATFASNETSNSLKQLN